MKLTPEELKEIKERADKATEGPWVHRIYAWKNTVTMPGCCEVAIPVIADGVFVAHSRTDIPRLLAHIAELEADLNIAIDRYDAKAVQYDALAAEIAESK